MQLSFEEENDPIEEAVPLVIRNAPTRLMKDLGYGKGYRLAHYEQDKVAADMQCLPDLLVGAEYYAPTREGREGLFADRLAELKELRTRRRSSGE